MAEIIYDIKRGADIYRRIYISRLQGWISTGKIKKGEILVWRSGLSGWRRAEELEELAGFFERWEKHQLRKLIRKDPKGQISFYKKRVKNILIIDDEKDLCGLLEDALSSRGYNVGIANTKREGINRLKREIPDAVFLDLKLPDGDGVSILPKIKKINPRIIVNIISAYGSDESKEEAKAKGVHTFIDKPFTEGDILRSLRFYS